jgi:hypothetical protein
MDILVMSDLQVSNFNRLPNFSEQETDALRKHSQPPNPPLSSAENETHRNSDDFKDLFERNKAIYSTEPTPPSPMTNENAETFATNKATFRQSDEVSADLFVAEHVLGLKHESVDPALFSAEDMDAIFGKTTMFDDAFTLDDAHKFQDSDSPLWETDGKNTNTSTLGSPFRSNNKLDHPYQTATQLTSDAKSNSQPKHMQEHIQSHAPPHIDIQNTFPEYAHPAHPENAQIARYRFPDGRRRSRSVPHESRTGIRPPVGMGQPHPPRQHHTPQPPFHGVIAEFGHHSMTPPAPYFRHHTPAMGAMTVGHGYMRQQPVFHREMGLRVSAVSPEPKRKRQKVSHLVEPRQEPMGHLLETLMGNVEFILKKAMAGMQYRVDDELEKYVYSFQLLPLEIMLMILVSGQGPILAFEILVSPILLIRWHRWHVVSHHLFKSRVPGLTLSRLTASESLFLYITVPSKLISYANESNSTDHSDPS